MKDMIRKMCMILGCMIVLSCGNKLSEKELKDLEALANNGDTKAIAKLKQYYGNMELPLSRIEYKELKEKAMQGDNDAQEKVAEYEKLEQAYNRFLLLSAKNGDPESAFWVSVDCFWDFTDSINVRENKKDYRKFMEIAIKGGYKESYDYNDGGMSHIDEYKKYYRNQTEEWWDSDSIKTKEQMSEE